MAQLEFGLIISDNYNIMFLHTPAARIIMSFFVSGVGLLFIIGPAVAVNERCLNDHTWRGTSTGKMYSYEALISDSDMCGNSATCGNRFPKPESLEDRPPPVPDGDEDLFLEFFGIILDPSKNSTCLGITYTLDRYGASKVKGLQFLLHGLGYNSHNKDCCQVLNYTVELSYEAVVENPNAGTPRKFKFDCFCDLWPLEPYRLVIRTLPVDFANETLLDPSSIYRDIKVPGCTPDREWDQYCQKSKEELWQPQLLKPEQLFPQYLELNVTFNIAPPDYRFSEYVISIYEENIPKPMDTQLLLTESLSSTPTMVNGLEMNVSSVVFTLVEGDIGKIVHASMFPRCDPGELECNTATHQNNAKVEIIENPCNWEPCGDFGVCEPHVDQYTCQCNEDAILVRHPMLDGDTCIESPCNSNPCGNLGTCYVVDTDHYCNCSSGAIYDRDRRTCISNPCDPSPCDKYSTCNITDAYKPDCLCTNGITCIVDECNQEDVETSDCIIRGSCIESSPHLMEGLKHYDCNCGYEVVDSTNVTNICADGTCDASSCDENTFCYYFDVPGGVRYNCSCVPGYKFNDRGMCEKEKSGFLWVIVLVAVLLLVVALIIALRFIIKSRPDKICLNSNPYIGAPTERVYLPVPNSHEGGGVKPSNNEVNKRILIICTEETEEHRDVVHKFANFLRCQAGLNPIIPSQNKQEIHTQTLVTWLSAENKRAFKVLFICSEGMWDRWTRDRDRDRDPRTAIKVETEFGDAFAEMKLITNKERERKLNKFAVAFFKDYFSKEKVEDIELFGGMPCFSLMADVEKLCFLLSGIEQHTPLSSRKMPGIQGYERSPEGQALLEAIRVLKHSLASPQPGLQPQYSRSASSDSTSPSEGSVSGHFELNSREGSAESIALREIPVEEQETMASASGFFFSNSSDSEDEGSTGIQHQVDVHRDSGEDLGLTPPVTPDCGQFRAVPQKSEEYSLGELDSGLSCQPASSTSMAGHLRSLDASDLAQPTPREAAHLDAGVGFIPRKLPNENELDSGLDSQPLSSISDAQGISLA